MVERWKPIKGYEGLYEVSDFGNIKNLNYRHTGKAKVLHLSARDGKYLKVTLTKEGKNKTFRVHRLVAEAFLLEPSSAQTQVNHIDGNKQNNFCTLDYSNIEWVSPKQNVNNPNTKPRMSIRYNKEGEFERRSQAQRKRFKEHPEDLVKMWEGLKRKRSMGKNGYICA